MIRLEQVSKRYGDSLAVDGVSFEVKSGEIVGFLGPNGAGKSTVLKLISTFLRPSSGSITVAGHDVGREPLAVRRALGYLTEHNALYDGMRVDRFLRFMGAARGLRGARLEQRLAWVVGRCALEEVVHKRVQQCSKGFRQRIGVAGALIHDPEVIVLDEPTHGLDPLQVVAFRDFLRGLSEGRAILFSSHILSEVAAISDRVLILNHGKLLYNDTVQELERSAKEQRTSLEAVVLAIVRQGQGVPA